MGKTQFTFIEELSAYSEGDIHSFSGQIFMYRYSCTNNTGEPAMEVG